MCFDSIEMKRSFLTFSKLVDYIRMALDSYHRIFLHKVPMNNLTLCSTIKLIPTRFFLTSQSIAHKSVASIESPHQTKIVVKLSLKMPSFLFAKKIVKLVMVSCDILCKLTICFTYIPFLYFSF